MDKPVLKTLHTADLVKKLLRRGALSNLKKMLQKIHPADIAVFFNHLSENDKKTVFRLCVELDKFHEITSLLEPSESARLLSTLKKEEIYDVIQKIESDDIVDILNELPEELAQEILSQMKKEDAENLESLLEFEEDTAGGIMNPNYLALDEDTTVKDAIETLQSSEDVEMVFYLYVIDSRNHLVGVVSLRYLVTTKVDTKLKDFMSKDVISVRTDMDQEEVAKTVLAALASSVGYAPAVWVNPATGIDYWMGVQYETNAMDSLEDIRNIPLSLNTKNGPTTVPLSNVATIRRVNIPGEVAHSDIARVYNVYANVTGGRDVGSVAADVERALAQLPKESGVTYTVRGPVQAMRSGIRLLMLGILVAAVLVYLVMMAQFRSFVDPLIIMLAVPLGFSGVLVVLYFTGTRIDIQSLIGALMMIGVVVNNSILLVEFANQLCQRGYDPKHAALAAAQIRLRPILMTTFAMVASMLPLSIHFAPGGEAMIPLARAFIGGVLVSTFLTLFLVPCVYSLVKRDLVPEAAG